MEEHADMNIPSKNSQWCNTGHMVWGGAHRKFFYTAEASKFSGGDGMDSITIRLNEILR